MLDTETNVKEEEQLTRMIDYIERNGRVGNYLHGDSEET